MNNSSFLRFLLVPMFLFTLFCWPAPKGAYAADLWEIRGVSFLERTQKELLSLRLNEMTRLRTVARGETLWDIAGGDKEKLELVAAMNYMDIHDPLYVGQHLIIPVERQRSYSVRKGDTLWDIARRNAIPVSSLVEFNDLQDPNSLHIGQKIIIPGSESLRESREEHGAVPVAARSKKLSFLNPVEVGVLTSAFGRRGNQFHHGWDLAAPVGTDIRAAEGGKVVFSGWRSSIYGNTVIIDHGNGYETLYAHNKRNLVHEGQRVYRGQKIAEIGLSGKTTGGHTHFEVRRNGKTVNPELFLSGIKWGT